MSTKQTRKCYPREFKEEAVALITEQGYSATRAAEAVGVTASLLYKWKEAFEAEKSGDALSIDEREELKRLRKENRELKMEKEILKKASAFFAKEMK
ncbi:transposase [Alteromonadaceae bacterium 2753L.S.0a.02]|nr:transposase [Alteromonadaceae bacterium 2753L.S.0a.02]